MADVTELLRRRGHAASAAVEIIATPADHDGRRYPIGRRTARARLRRCAAPAPGVYFAGDTDLFDEMTELADIDLAILPIARLGADGGRGAPRPAARGRGRRASEPRAVLPIHWGTMLKAGLERKRPELLTDPAEKIRAEMESRAPDVALHLLAARRVPEARSLTTPEPQA